MAPAAEEGRVSSEECGPNATRGLAESVRLDGFDKTFRARLKSLDVAEMLAHSSLADSGHVCISATSRDCQYGPRNS